MKRERLLDRIVMLLGARRWQEMALAVGCDPVRQRNTLADLDAEITVLRAEVTR
jgi:hypothetical protein